MIISPAKAVTSSALGTPFPRSQVSSSETANGCGERYKFSTDAPLASVAKFYLEEGNSAGLTLLADTDAGDPAYRMISFIRPNGHEVLFVTVTRKGELSHGTVYYAPANDQKCS